MFIREPSRSTDRYLVSGSSGRWRSISPGRRGHWCGCVREKMRGCRQSAWYAGPTSRRLGTPRECRVPDGVGQALRMDSKRKPQTRIVNRYHRWYRQRKTSNTDRGHINPWSNNGMGRRTFKGNSTMEAEQQCISQTKGKGVITVSKRTEEKNMKQKPGHTAPSS